MASRFWNFVANLLPGQTARAEQVNEKLQEIDTALQGVESEMNRTVRFMDGTPGQTDFQILQDAAQRALKLMGFDAGGAIALISAGFTWRGDWAAGVQYNVNDMVKAPIEHDLSLYVARTSHVSTNFDDDVLAFRWALAVDLTEVRRSLILHQLIVGPDTVDLESGQDVMVDVTGGPVTLVLPPTPAISDQPINVMHVGGSINANPITIDRNGKPIMGLNEDMTIDTPNASFGLAFCDDTRGWRIRGV